MKKIFKAKGGKTMNIWKIVAVVFIVLFCLALAGGLFRIYHSGPLPNAPTHEQMDSAKAIVAQELANNGDDISNYEVTVSTQIRRLERGSAPFFGMEGPEGSQGFAVEMPAGNTIHVSLRSNSTTHFYLVNVDSGKIIMHSFTEWMGNG
jgi:hypothetical protein